ncbi:hypothetical protein Hanom_Chr01g00070631 [Helianthus anomalus]
MPLISEKWLDDFTGFERTLTCNMSGTSLFVDRLKCDFLFLILNGSSVEFQPLAIDFKWCPISSFNFYCTVWKNMGD